MTLADSILVSEPDQGMYDAINKGLKQATGEIVGILNADDYYPANDVLSLVRAEFTDTTVDACYGDLIYVDRRNTDKVVRNWRSGPFDRRKFYSGWMPPHPTFFVRKKQSSASSGMHTIGSFSLKEVLSNRGTPVCCFYE